MRTAQGKLYLLVAIDRTSKFAFVELHEKVARSTAADFLRRLVAAVPYKVHTVLTDNGTHFTTPGNRRRRTSLGACLRIRLRQERHRSSPHQRSCRRWWCRSAGVSSGFRRVWPVMSCSHGGQLDEGIVAERCDGFQGHVAGTLDRPLDGMDHPSLSEE